jgi:phosphoribosylformimino-5-aminoimidazole carboxamide ribonucleotide (ProFAR) isomerase
VPGTLIAAGGVATATDIGAAIAAGADAVVSGRAILDGSLEVADALRAARL